MKAPKSVTEAHARMTPELIAMGKEAEDALYSKDFSDEEANAKIAAFNAALKVAGCESASIVDRTVARTWSYFTLR